MIRTLHADAALIGDGTTIRDAMIALDDDGTILEVAPARALDGRAIERVRGVVAPALVNAHTHLELSALAGTTRLGAGFVPWLESLQRARSEEDEAARDAAIDRAIADLQELGVVGVGEVTNSLAAARRLARSSASTIFAEVFGVDRDGGFARIVELAGALEELPPSIRAVVAPHALYSTHPDVVRAIAAANAHGPLTIHLAEHAAERAFLRDGSGPFLDFLAARSLAERAKPLVAATDPIARAEALGLLRRDAALVHLADARPQELDRVAAAGSIAVLCPRSNLAIETRLPPVLAMRARGVPLALGTDSLASSPSLDPIAEARALADRFPEVPCTTWIAAATSIAARAIGWGDAIGLLAPSRRPGVILFEGALPSDADPSTWVIRTKAPRRWLARRGAA